MSIYSKCFIAEGGLGGDFTVTVPAGKVWIVRDIDAVALSAGAGTIGLLRNGGIHTWQALYVSGAAGYWYGFRGRVVFAAGETLTVDGDPGPWDVTVCGYELTSS